jgi:asparagine synthase (glutamine-hydrolysing)
MCGFAGILSLSGSRQPELQEQVRRMATRLAHRGPDDSGEWADPEAGIAFGFRRLSILDLSILGHQPMTSAGGRFVLMFNGEIFNHLELREGLKQAGQSFRGGSDTETLLAGIEVWGLEETLKRCVGMFAIAMWDRLERRLSLARDRLGKKPLFVARYGGRVAFASELKAIATDPDFPRELDQASVVSYLRHLYVPWPRTIYRYAEKLPPASILTISGNGGGESRAVYWSLAEVARNGCADPLPDDPELVLELLDQRLRTSVHRRLLSDVPLGSLLSGGIDSSVVTAMAAQVTTGKLRTFSVSFPDSPEHNEGPFARAVAEHCGTEHVELAVRGEDMLEVVPRLPELFDEPMADHSLLPVHAICRQARSHVTVVLTGDGGDELFAGYHRYFDGDRLISRVAGLPTSVRRAAGTCMEMLGDGPLTGLAAVARRAGARGALTRLPAQRLRKVGRLLRERSSAAMYRSLVSAWPTPGVLVPGIAERRCVFDDLLEAQAPAALIDRMMLADQASYMTDDQLAKVDRVSMAVSLEARVPMLDHEVVELAWRIPWSLKARGGQGKWILRQLLYRRYVPQQLVDRPKVGFTVPMGAWLRGPLRPWAEAMIEGPRLKEGGILASVPLRREWARLLNGDDSRANGLWAALMLLAWAEAWL